MMGRVNESLILITMGWAVRVSVLSFLAQGLRNRLGTMLKSDREAADEH
jgi:hypothetical protein